jgi:hypothetical protein
MCKPLASDEQRCREEWIHGGKIEDPNTHEVKIYPGCKVRDTAPLTRIAVEQRGRLPIFVGVDLAWGNSKKSDRSAFFALGVGARGARIVLNIESAKGMTGPQIVRKLFDWHERYDPFLIQVESVAAQKFIVDFAREIGEDAEHRLRNIRVRGYVTKKIDKFSSEVGIEQLFTEFERGLWKIPANSEGRCVKEIQEWIDEMTGWRPGAHAGDRLMAGWFAWKAAYRRLLAAAPRSPKAKNERNPDELAKDLRTRRPNWRGRDGANTLTDWTKGTY